MLPLKKSFKFTASVFIILLLTSFNINNEFGITMNSGFNPQQPDVISLPEPRFFSELSVEQALLNRRSVRDFTDEPVTLSEVSQLLWSAYGITEEHSYPSFLRGGLRTAPSAGALYPLEIYLVAGNVKGLKKGIYRYISDGHFLELISDGDFRKDLSDAALDQEFIAQAPASLVYTAIFKRTTQKYGNRGRERYVCMDLGHSAQNVYLQAYALNIGTCAVGAFTDRMVSMVMQLPDNEEPLYIMPLGKF